MHRARSQKSLTKSQEVKKKTPKEMADTTNKVKNTLEGINSKPNDTDEWASQLEGGNRNNRCPVLSLAHGPLWRTPFFIQRTVLAASSWVKPLTVQKWGLARSLLVFWAQDSSPNTSQLISGSPGVLLETRFLNDLLHHLRKDVSFSATLCIASKLTKVLYIEQKFLTRWLAFCPLF